MLTEHETDYISPDQVEMIYYLIKKTSRTMHEQIINDIYKRWGIKKIAHIERNQFYTTIDWLLQTTTLLNTLGKGHA